MLSPFPTLHDGPAGNLLSVDWLLPPATEGADPLCISGELIEPLTTSSYADLPPSPKTPSASSFAHDEPLSENFFDVASTPPCAVFFFCFDLSPDFYGLNVLLWLPACLSIVVFFVFPVCRRRTPGRLPPPSILFKTQTAGIIAKRSLLCRVGIPNLLCGRGFVPGSLSTNLPSLVALEGNFFKELRPPFIQPGFRLGFVMFLLSTIQSSSPFLPEF